MGIWKLTAAFSINVRDIVRSLEERKMQRICDTPGILSYRTQLWYRYGFLSKWRKKSQNIFGYFRYATSITCFITSISNTRHHTYNKLCDTRNKIMNINELWKIWGKEKASLTLEWCGSLQCSTPIFLVCFISTVTGKANSAQHLGPWSLLCIHRFTDAMVFPVPATSHTLSPNIVFLKIPLERTE